MKIYDMHIHIMDGKPDADELVRKLSVAGIYGGAVISPEPSAEACNDGTDYENRIQTVFEWTKGYEGRLFPILWIHPDEINVEEHIRDAVKRGIAGFKMICNNYYVSDEAPMKILRLIAELGKPVIFHSGILWDGAVSSKYNKPVNWEALLEIPKLRFSMGHCSWPWHDECIALYGKILNAYLINPDSCEMFFDLTPGTPEIYREDLFFKLFHTGYDVPHNIMFGTDSTASTYGPEWVLNWLNVDNKLYDKLGVPNSIRQLIYEDNFLRFIGVKEKDFTHRLQSPDSGIAWTLSDGI